MNYPIGTLAYYDSFQGLIPCKITEIISGGVKAVITQTKGSYTKGDTAAGSSLRFPPRKHIRRRKYSTTIVGGYEYK